MLFAAGVVDGGSGLTYNPANDTLTVNGADISATSFRGSGSTVVLSNDNNSSTVQVKVTDKVELLQASATKLETTNDGVSITGICTGTDFSGASGGYADFPNGLSLADSKNSKIWK